MANGYVLTVSQLNDYVAGLFRREPLLNDLTLKGEISGFKHHSSGHLYFSMKDGAALVRCVMFRQNAVSLPFSPQDGMQVQATGSVSLYVKDGQYQFYVKAMLQEGEGELYRRFLLLKTRLEAKGLFAPEHKKPLPLLPRRVGIVTSATGAAVQDIYNVIRRRFPTMDLILCPVAVQGEGAAAQIAAAIRALNGKQAADVMIVGRGGGSLEDLWAFNEETVARAIYDSKIPVISAVGHETDFTIADFTADLRAPTPSAAAELCVPEYTALLASIERAKLRMAQAASEQLRQRKEKLLTLSSSGAMLQPRHSIGMGKSSLHVLQEQLQNAARGAITAAYAAQQQQQSALQALDPRSVMQRGYALVRAENGEYLDSADRLNQQKTAKVEMWDGSVRVTVAGKA